MRRVFLISPFRGSTLSKEDARLTREDNLNYMRRAMHDCLLRSEAPFAPHGLYPQCLDDGDPAQRALGIAAGHAFIPFCHAAACYIDRGISSGMRGDLAHYSIVPWAGDNGHIEYRSLDGPPPTEAWLRENDLPIR